MNFRKNLLHGLRDFCIGTNEGILQLRVDFNQGRLLSDKLETTVADTELSTVIRDILYSFSPLIFR